MIKNEEKNEDLRVRRTRKMLWEAFFELLDQKPFEKISVIEICEQAMVHRTTFYKHFEDKFHLLSYGLQEIKDAIFLKTPGVDRKDINRFLCKAIAENTRLFNVLFSVNETNSLSPVLRHFAATNMEEELRKETAAGEEFTMPIPIIANFYAGAIMGLFSWWIENDLKIPADELSSYLDQLLFDFSPQFLTRIHQ